MLHLSHQRLIYTIKGLAHIELGLLCFYSRVFVDGFVYGVHWSRSKIAAVHLM